jgi:hypothetical protein
MAVGAGHQRGQSEAGGLLHRPVPAVRAAGAAVLPYALAMAGIILALDIAWFSVLAFAVDRAG